MRLGITHMSNIDIAIKGMASKLGLDLVLTPATTQHTLSLGVKHSPEMVCLPFKLQLGNMIEALEMGADTIVMPGGPGPCRFGYYHKTHEAILRELGYEFNMVTQDRGIMHIIKYCTNGAPMREILGGFRFGIAKLKAMDELEQMVHKIRAVARDKNEVTRIFRQAAQALDNAQDYQAIKQVKQEYLGQLMSLPTVPSPAPLKIGLTGEFFVVIDPFANMDIEAELGKLGVWVQRTIFIGDWVSLDLFRRTFGLREKNKAHKAALPYVSRHVGGDGWQSVGEKVLHAKDWDGIVHLEPLGCMPEITARNIMPATREKLPVLNLIYDEHTGKAGVVSRLEAFVDMIQRKKRVAACV